MTDIERQMITIDGVTYTAEDCRTRLRAEFSHQYGEDSFQVQLAGFLQEWFDGSDTLSVHTSGSTGVPKELRVEKERMMNSARMTVDFLGQCFDSPLDFGRGGGHGQGFKRGGIELQQVSLALAPAGKPGKIRGGVK